MFTQEEIHQILYENEILIQRVKDLEDLLDLPKKDIILDSQKIQMERFNSVEFSETKKNFLHYFYCVEDKLKFKKISDCARFYQYNKPFAFKLRDKGKVQINTLFGVKTIEKLKK